MSERPLASANPDTVEEALHRLSKKPGVKAWLMLDRFNGALLKTNGQIASVRPPRSSNSHTSLPTPTGGSFSTDVNDDTNNETQAAQELASMIWSFLSSAVSLTGEMDSDDEVKLLRLRTKKHEIVIVPEVKYLLVVVHDTPAA
ncbi:hypothetical protein F4778DRAFT_761963 [Xylariomycetidae sp. FL2044]|nr:hypothetical protein F4778DRAFT_761963 [Xylariomycetidae sp. FL2044]